MKMNEDNEIQVLGTPRNKPSQRKGIIMSIIALLFMALLGYFLIADRNHIENNNGPDEVATVITQPASDTTAIDLQPSVKLQIDSINDVVVNIYSLKNLKAELSLQIPNRSDTTVFFVVQAADIRRDNKEIVGDFVLKGKPLSKGKRKTGYCAIIDGKITIGNSINDDMKEYCITHQGDLFRQYPLVINGEIQENRLKGKAIRRALAQQNNDFYLVESLNRESIYDFSEALSDLGFTHALYLVGGISYGWWRENATTTNEVGVYNKNPLPNTNYIVFKEVKSH